MKKDWRKTAIAAAIVCGVLALLAVLFIATDRAARAEGPSKLALASDGSVWLQSHGALHRFSASGERLQRISLADLGRQDILSDILPLRDGSLLLAEAKPSATYRCNPDARTCDALRLNIPDTPPTTAGVLTLAVDEAHERLYIADNANHRLLVADWNGTVLAVSPDGAVLFPNELALDANGRLVVADTNHHRIVRFTVKDDRFGEPEFILRTSDNKLGRHGRVWPNDFAETRDGGIWVLNADNGMRNADLLIFDAEGKAQRRIELGVDADPTQLLALEDRVLVADPTRIRLDAFDMSGKTAGVWGDASFQSELQALRLERKHWTQVRWASQIGIVLLPVLGIFCLWRLGERLPRRERSIGFDPNVEAAPVEGGMQWLAVSARFKRSARTMIVVVSLLCLGGAGFCFWLLYDNVGHWNALLQASSMRERFALVAALIVLLSTPFLAVFLEPPAWRRRIGTDGQKFFLDDGKGGISAHEFGDLLYDGQQILVGKQMVKVAVPMGALFDKFDVQRYILPRLPKEAHVAGITLLTQSLRRGNLQMWAAVSLMALMLVFSIAAPLLGWTSRHSQQSAEAASTAAPATDRNR